jgi:hypothetical protein
MQQQIGMAMIPEHAMDFSMLDLNTDGGFSYQPQVFSVLSMPETVIDSEVLSGKTSFSSALPSDDEKVELPKVERIPTPEPAPATKEVEVVDEEFDADPTFALFTSAPATSSAAPESKEVDLSAVMDLLNGIQPEKAFARIELIVKDSSADDAVANAAMARVMRMCASLDTIAERLSVFTLE